MPALLAAGILSAQTMVSWQDVSTPSVSYTPELDGGVAVTTDANGHVYTVGNFTNNTTIGTDNLTYAGTGGRDIYVARYTTSGTFEKAVRLGSNYDDIAYSIAWKTDGTNDFIFVTAYVDGVGTIYVLNDDANLTTSITQPIYAGVHPRSIVSYGTNRLVVGGSFYEYAELPKSSGTINLTASNSGSGSFYDSFTGIIDMNADFTFGGNVYSSTDDNEIMSIACRNGYIYATGYFKGQMQWDNGGTTMTAAGVQDLFVASVYISTSVNLINFANDQLQAGSIESQPSGGAGLQPDWKECGYAIAANGTAIYVTGNLNNASTPLFDGSSYSTAGSGAFTARINYSGSQLGAVNWVRACVNSGGSAVTRSIGYSIALDANGDVYSSGAAYADTYFKDGSGSTVVSNGSNASDRPGYVVKYNSSGTIQWVDAINQQVINGQRCEGHGMAADGCSIYNTGWVSGSGSFQAGTLTPESVSGTAVAIYIFGFSRDFSVSNNITRCEPCTAFPLTGGITTTGGTTYGWTPTTYLTNYTTATPTYTVPTCTTVITNYTVTISNATCTTSVPFVLNITGHPAANAGSDVSACPNTSYYIGVTGTTGFTYSWAPVNGYLTAYNVARPAFSTTTTAVLPITYTLTQTDPCGNVTTDQVTITSGHCRMANPNGTTQTTDVFPNPSVGIFNINLTVLEEESDVEFVVTDLTGRVVQQSTVTTAGGPVALDLSGEAKGVYMLSVTRNGVTEQHKLIIE